MKKLIKALKAKWKAESTKAGKILVRIVLIAEILAAASTEAAEAYNLLPEGFVPIWLKTIIGIFAIYGFVKGKMFMNKPENNAVNNNQNN